MMHTILIAGFSKDATGSYVTGIYSICVNKIIGYKSSA